MPSDELYTLDEAERILARRECAQYGCGTFSVIRSGAQPLPIKLVCERCGTSYVREDLK